MNKNKLTRYAIAAVALVGALFLSGCSPKVLDFRNVEISNGKIYERGANKGFTGDITNFPDTQLVVLKNVVSPFWQPVNAVSGAQYEHQMRNMFGLCNASVRDGVTYGEAVCTRPQTKILRYKMSFDDEGLLDGPFKVYDLTADNNVVSSAKFKSGKLNGKQEIFSLKAQKLIYRINWEKGVAEGAEERFDENTGNLISHIEYKNGLLDGNMVRYAPDGKLVIYRAAFLAGLARGVEEQFDAATGKPRLYAEWVNGVRSEASVKEWDAFGEALSRAPGAPSSSQIDECVDRWSYVFRREQGGDAAVSMDQIGEWTSWCKQGKKPG